MKAQVLKKLQDFQEGYTKRDVDNIDAFAADMFLDSEDTIIIGTGHGEWCKGLSVIKELLYIDWFYWGNFTLDIDQSHVYVRDHFATIHTTGVLEKAYDTEKMSDYTLSNMSKIINSDDGSEEKIYKSLKSMAYFLHEAHVGQGVKRKVRFSATLENIGDDWKFANIHFSYPVAPPTDVKVVD